MARRILVSLGVMLAAAAEAGCGGDKPPGPPHTHRGGTVTCRADPVESGPLTDSIANRAVAIVRRRLAALDVRQATVTRSGALIRVTLPEAQQKTLTEGHVTAVGRLAFYDWEPNVIGPDGKPAPSDGTVTGGASAGTPGAASVSHYVAVLRAAKRSPTANGSGELYLVDAGARTVVAGPAGTRAALRRGRGGAAGPRAAWRGGGGGSQGRVGGVGRGTLIARAETTPGSRPVDQWYVL